MVLAPLLIQCYVVWMEADMNIVMTIMSGSHPLQVAIKRTAGGFHAKTLGEQNPAEVESKTFNGAIDAIGKAAARNAVAA